MTVLLAASLGLDAGVLRDLTGSERARMLWLVVATAFACGVAGEAALDATRAMAPGSRLGWLAALAAAAFVWNLLRLLNAGCGLALHATPEEVERWRPTTWLPMCVFWVMAIVLAQPALLGRANPELDALVIRHRGELVRMRERAAVAPWNESDFTLSAELRTLPAGDTQRRAQIEAELQAIERERVRVERDDVRPYAKHLETLTFPVLRLTELWKQPWRAAGFTLLFVLCMSAPLLLRELRPALIRSYEAERQARERELVLAAYRDTERQVHALLSHELRALAAVSGVKRDASCWELPKPQFVDAPFNRVAVTTRFDTAEELSADQLLDAILRQRKAR